MVSRGKRRCEFHEERVKRLDRDNHEGTIEGDHYWRQVWVCPKKRSLRRRWGKIRLLASIHGDRLETEEKKSQEVGVGLKNSISIRVTTNCVGKGWGCWLLNYGLGKLCFNGLDFNHGDEAHSLAKSENKIVLQHGFPFRLFFVLNPRPTRYGNTVLMRSN